MNIIITSNLNIYYPELALPTIRSYTSNITKVLDLIEHDNIIWEKEPLQALASAEQLSVFKHKGFWQPMDTLRDKNILEDSWSSGKASWKLW
jgi:NDP-sugar pyrophosphorylase family protein